MGRVPLIFYLEKARMKWKEASGYYYAVIDNQFRPQFILLRKEDEYFVSLTNSLYSEDFGVELGDDSLFPLVPLSEALGRLKAMHKDHP